MRELQSEFSDCRNCCSYGYILPQMLQKSFAYFKRFFSGASNPFSGDNTKKITRTWIKSWNYSGLDIERSLMVIKTKIRSTILSKNSIIWTRFCVTKATIPCDSEPYLQHIMQIKECVKSQFLITMHDNIYKTLI